jgi:heme-degrading monooxygenase HmoA
MYSATFIWEPGEYDDEFHRLNALIDQAARGNPGFLGTESWQTGDGVRRSAVYYWSDLESLETFAADPVHLEAKGQYDRWYRGYQIVIAKVVRSYGDGAIPHVTTDAE